MRPAALAALFFIAGCLGYLGLSFALFEMPMSAEAAEHCGFLPGDFTSTGALAYERSAAWWISFQRKEEIFSLLSVGLASGFAGFALRVGRGGAGALGGGLLALSALCVSCLAPVLSVVGLGMAASLLAGVPKSLIFLNTLLLTGWGALYLSRRASRGCPRAEPFRTRRKKPDRITPMNRPLYTATALCALLLASPVLSQDARLTPLAPGVPLAHPVAKEDLPPPPFSLLSERPVNPAYVPGLPGLKQGVAVKDDFGLNRPPKFDSVLIRKSRVENGEVVIPSGGLAYLEDTWGGEVALRGEPLPMLGRMPTYIDYDMSIVIKNDVTIPAGQSTVVGGQVYHYFASVGHEKTVNHTLHVRTIAGQDWEWAFGAPVFSANQPQWWAGQGNKGFTQLYNQGQIREAGPQKLVFDWLSGVRTDRMLAGDKAFAGLAGVGESLPVGTKTVRVAANDEAKGTVDIEVIEGGKVVLTRTLGPIDNNRLIEDTAARKALVFEHGDIAGFLSPWPEGFKDGKANLKLYSNTLALEYGKPFKPDARFTAFPVGCPTGHNFGFMLVNAQEIRLKPGTKAEGPEGFFRVAVNKVENGKVLDWHIEDKAGNRSINLGGGGIENVDLVLGQGRVTGQAILKDVGKALLNRTYQAASGQPQAPQVATAAPQAQVAQSAGLSSGLLAALAIAAAAIGAIGFQLGRRKRSA